MSARTTHGGIRSIRKKTIKCMECFASYIIISLHVCADSGSPAPAQSSWVMALEEFLCINGRVAERVCGECSQAPAVETQPCKWHWSYSCYCCSAQPKTCASARVWVQIAARVVKRLKKRRADILFFSTATTATADFHPVKISALLHTRVGPFYISWATGGFRNISRPYIMYSARGLERCLRRRRCWLWCFTVSISRAARHTESQGRLVGFRGLAQQRRCWGGGAVVFQTARRCEAQSEHITLVNALPSGSECGSVYAIKITFNCAFGIVDGCTCTTTTWTKPPGAAPPTATATQRNPRHTAAVSALVQWIARCVMNDDRYRHQDIIETNANSGRVIVSPPLLDSSPLIGTHSTPSDSLGAAGCCRNNWQIHSGKSLTTIATIF